MTHSGSYLDFSGKHVLITGASGAIGKALAMAFHQHNAHVILVGRDQKKLDDVVQSTLQTSSRVETIVCDLSNIKDLEKLATEIKSLNLDVLINNAGLTRDQLAIRLSLDAWDEVLNVNLKSAFVLSQAMITSCIKKRSEGVKTGAIINMASVVGVTGNPGQVNYVASKAGLIGMTKSLALEYASRGVRVNAIAPGYITSEMTAKLPQETLKDHIPMKNFGSPEDVAHGALFLASPLAAYITGHTLHINGGLFCG